MLQYGTPSIFNARRTANKETTPSPAPAPPSFDNSDSTPAMLRRARSPPVSPSALSLAKKPVNLALGLMVFLLMVTAWFWSATVPEDHERVAALTAVVRAQESEMKTLHSTISSLAASAARQESTTAALVSRLQAAEGKLAAGVTTPAADAKGADGPTLVHVHFIFDATPLLGPEVELFWLSGNSTEKLYTTIPAGKQVDEATFPGQCWRARDPRTGNHLAMYCATDEPVQHVHITPHSSVSVEFHFAPTAKLGKRVRVVSLATAAERKTGAPAEMTVGEIEQDGHLTTRAHAGTRFRVVDAASGRRLLETQASYEAEQHVDVGTNVSLGVTLPAQAAGSAQLYWLWVRRHTGAPARPR